MGVRIGFRARNVKLNAVKIGEIIEILRAVTYYRISIAMLLFFVVNAAALA
jgi:hypothetical protein